jgi:hypothetical protein
VKAREISLRGNAGLPRFSRSRVLEMRKLASQRTDGAAKVEQRQFEMSVTFASELHVEQNGTRCCFVD